jgi:hypothetical protein
MINTNAAGAEFGRSVHQMTLKSVAVAAGGA